MVFIGVDLDQIEKMAPRRVKSAPGPIELSQHFGAKTSFGFRVWNLAQNKNAATYMNPNELVILGSSKATVMTNDFELNILNILL